MQRLQLHRNEEDLKSWGGFGQSNAASHHEIQTDPAVNRVLFALHGMKFRFLRLLQPVTYSRIAFDSCETVKYGPCSIRHVLQFKNKFSS